MARSPARCNFQGRRVAHFWRRYLHKVADEMIEAEKLIGAGFTHEAHAITRRDGEALLGSMTGGTGASIHDGSSLRLYSILSTKNFLLDKQSGHAFLLR